MKKLAMVVISLLAALGCVAFAACTPAEESNNNNNNQQQTGDTNDDKNDDKEEVELPEPVVLEASYDAYYQTSVTESGVATTQTQLYDLELYSDGTYVMVYNACVMISFVPTFNYGRIVTTYGTYKITDGALDENAMTVELSAPTRVRLAAYANNNQDNGAMTVVDSDKWLDGDPDGDGEDGFYYTLFQRAESEYYTDVETFMNALGRAYTCECTTNEMNPYNKQMKVTVNDERGQIPIDAACPEGVA